MAENVSWIWEKETVLKQNPLISVIMPVYNGEKYLREAIDSILNQTYTNFEFIILNDGSTDRTEEIILSYDDSRIVYVKNEENLQIVKTLNKGIALAKGKYIARMDADDISLSERFEKQIYFMEQNSEVDICGTWIQMFGGKDIHWKPPTTHDDIKVELLFGSGLAHPTVMGRRSFFVENKYKEKFEKAEDYALWVETIDKYHFINIPEFLLLYRTHTSQISMRTKNEQNDITNIIRKDFIRNFKEYMDCRDLKNFQDFINQKSFLSFGIEESILAFIEANKKYNYFVQAKMEQEISNFYWEQIKKCMQLQDCIVYISSPLRKYAKVTLMQVLKSYIVRMMDNDG